MKTQTKTKLTVVPPAPSAPAEPTPPTQRRLIPLPKWSEHHPWPTLGQLRKFVTFRDDNGADVWVVRVGNRLLIDEAKFFEWARTVGDRAKRTEPKGAA